MTDETTEEIELNDTVYAAVIRSGGTRKEAETAARLVARKKNRTLRGRAKKVLKNNVGKILAGCGAISMALAYVFIDYIKLLLGL